MLEDIWKYGESGNKVRPVATISVDASYLMRLCEHLLKLLYWESQRDRCGRGWQREVQHFRFQIQALLRDSPSLRNYLDEIYEQEYRQGRTLFLDMSGLSEKMIPEEPGFTLPEALDTPVEILHNSPRGTLRERDGLS